MEPVFKVVSRFNDRLYSWLSYSNELERMKQMDRGRVRRYIPGEITKPKESCGLLYACKKIETAQRMLTLEFDEIWLAEAHVIWNNPHADVLQCSWIRLLEPYKP